LGIQKTDFSWNFIIDEVYKQMIFLLPVQRLASLIAIIVTETEILKDVMLVLSELRNTMRDL
jgi:hypothetical protein